MNLLDALATNTDTLRAVTAKVTAVSGRKVTLSVQGSTVAGIPVASSYQDPKVNDVVVALKIGSAWVVVSDLDAAAGHSHARLDGNLMEFFTADGTRRAYINSTEFLSQGKIYGYQGDLHLGPGYALAIKGSDSYLRINQDAAFSNGVWFGNSPVRMGRGQTLTLGSDGGGGQITIRTNYNDTVNRIDIDGGAGQIWLAGIHVSGGDWVRVYGQQGIYFQSYGGGWNMTDGTWIRAYGGKYVYAPRYASYQSQWGLYAGAEDFITGSNSSVRFGDRIRITDWSGNAYQAIAAAAFQVNSSRADKVIEGDLGRSASEIIRKAKPKKYRYREEVSASQSPVLGPMAEDLPAEFVEVDEDGPGTEFVNVLNLVGLLWQSNGEQQEEIDALRTEVDDLRAQIADLVKRVDKAHPIDVPTPPKKP